MSCHFNLSVGLSRWRQTCFRMMAAQIGAEGGRSHAPVLHHFHPKPSPICMHSCAGATTTSQCRPQTTLSPLRWIKWEAFLFDLKLAPFGVLPFKMATSVHNQSVTLSVGSQRKQERSPSNTHTHTPPKPIILFRTSTIKRTLTFSY